MGLSILGWGTALPEVPVNLGEVVDFALSINGLSADQARALPVLYRRTGIRGKHSVLIKAGAGGEKYQEFYQPMACPDDRGPTTRERMRAYADKAPGLALNAAHTALAQAEVTAGEITHLIVVTCTGFTAPGVDLALYKGLGLAPGVERVLVGFMGCHGALNGLKVANGLVAVKPGARVLVCAVELCSLHYQYGWDPDRVVANALFADGAAALVVAAAGEGCGGAWRLEDTGSFLFSDSADAMTWKLGDHGFEMTLSARVPDMIGRGLRPWLESWLAGHGLGLDGVATWAVHPGGPRILSAVEQALGLGGEATAVSREVLRTCGNMSSPTILFILKRLVEQMAPRPCVALAFGPGLVAEGALFR